jgi:hypothetical protein
VTARERKALVVCDEEWRKAEALRVWDEELRKAEAKWVHKRKRELALSSSSSSSLSPSSSSSSNGEAEEYWHGLFLTSWWSDMVRVAEEEEKAGEEARDAMKAEVTAGETERVDAAEVEARRRKAVADAEAELENGLILYTGGKEGWLAQAVRKEEMKMDDEERAAAVARALKAVEAAASDKVVWVRSRKADWEEREEWAASAWRLGWTRRLGRQRELASSSSSSSSSSGINDDTALGAVWESEEVVAKAAAREVLYRKADCMYAKVNTAVDAAEEAVREAREAAKDKADVEEVKRLREKAMRLEAKAEEAKVKARKAWAAMDAATDEVWDAADAAGGLTKARLREANEELRAKKAKRARNAAELEKVKKERKLLAPLAPGSSLLLERQVRLRQEAADWEEEEAAAAAAVKRKEELAEAARESASSSSSSSSSSTLSSSPNPSSSSSSSSSSSPTSSSSPNLSSSRLSSLISFGINDADAMEAAKKVAFEAEAAAQDCEKAPVDNKVKEMAWTNAANAWRKLVETMKAGMAARTEKVKKMEAHARYKADEYKKINKYNLMFDMDD